jgi:IstB-like ATP binding protein
LIEESNEARELAELRKYRAQINAADLLLIDDLFLRRLPPNAGDELADVLMSRDEKSSVVITSNRMVDDWGNFWEMWSSLRPYLTASCTTVACSSSKAKATGSKKLPRKLPSAPSARNHRLSRRCQAGEFDLAPGGGI